MNMKYEPSFILYSLFSHLIQSGHIYMLSRYCKVLQTRHFILCRVHLFSHNRHHSNWLKFSNWITVIKNVPFYGPQYSSQVEHKKTMEHQSTISTSETSYHHQPAFTIHSAENCHNVSFCILLFTVFSVHTLLNFKQKMMWT